MEDLKMKYNLHLIKKYNKIMTCKLLKPQNLHGIIL